MVINDSASQHRIFVLLLLLLPYYRPVVRIRDILMAKSSIERCSSAPSTNRLSISEKTMTSLFFFGSGIVSSKMMAW